MSEGDWRLLVGKSMLEDSFGCKAKGGEGGGGV